MGSMGYPASPGRVRQVNRVSIAILLITFSHLSMPTLLHDWQTRRWPSFLFTLPISPVARIAARAVKQHEILQAMASSDFSAR